MRFLGLSILLLAFAFGCADPAQDNSAVPSPPTAGTRPVELEAHGDVRLDPYYWLRERDDPEVIRYLEAENAYTEAVMGHTESLQETLFDEMRGRIAEDDSSVPVRRDNYWYQTRYETGGEYPIYVRRADGMESPEEIMLDGNALAEGHGFFAIGGVSVSSGENLLAYATDTIGRRIYTIRFKDLGTGEILADEIAGSSGNFAWAEDNRTLFYTRRDLETLRSFQIYRHVLSTDAGEDELVFEEKDETFSCFVRKSKSKHFLMIGSSHTLANEVRFLDASTPDGEFTVFLPRERGHEYRVAHLGEYFYIRTNKDAQNFRLMRTPVDSTGLTSWSEVIGHRDDVLLEGFELFRDHLVVAERREGLLQIRIKPWKGEEHYLEFDEPAYAANVGANPEIDTTSLRFVYSSMTTPRSVFDYDMVTRERELKKRQSVLGGFDLADYRTERLMATARDGAQVPISLVYRVGFEADGKSPLLLYGYGSYGSSLDASFSSSRSSLLDRGFVYATAHIRGGEEMGRSWYENGKLLQKKNTFTDFIDSGEFLVENGYADPERLFAQGGSAGGLLVGAVINMRPGLFEGAVARVPFVDVVTTMLDASIPLTGHSSGTNGEILARRSTTTTCSPTHPTIRSRPRTIRTSWSPLACTTPRFNTGSRRSGSPSYARSRPTTMSSCSRPRWRPATAARVAAFAACVKSL